MASPASTDTGRFVVGCSVRPVIAASYSTRDAGWETNPQCYRVPDYLRAINGRSFWEAAGGTWMGHAIAERRTMHVVGEPDEIAATYPETASAWRRSGNTRSVLVVPVSPHTNVSSGRSRPRV